MTKNFSKPLFIYCYDAWCGWCYGFSKNLLAIYDRYQSKMDFEVLSGNMIPEEYTKPIGATANMLKQLYPQVEEATGAQFGADWKWHIEHPELSDWQPNSELSAIAMSVFKTLKPTGDLYFAADLQKSLFEEGRDLTDPEAFRHLLPKYGLNETEFYKMLASEESKQMAHYDFALCRQLQVQGFPAAFIQVREQKFYQVVSGYASLQMVTQTIESVLKESGPWS